MPLTFHFGNHPRSPFGSSLIFSGALCLLFGFAIILAPELLAYFVATLLIIMGTSMLVAGWKMRK